jgi:hypothetical protein
MRVRLATIATAFVIAGSAGSIMLPVATASAAKPDLCETSCEGSWGAREHAVAFAEAHGLSSITIEGCKKNSEHGAQWVCWGTGWEGANRWHFHVWMGEYGREKWWTWDGVG